MSAATPKQKLMYLIAAIILFAIEVLIALYVRDDFIRPYIGDVLAIALLYTVLRAVSPLSVMQAIALTLAIAFAIEIAQALNFLDAIGLRNNAFARIILGGVFDYADLIAYAVGAAIIFAVERVLYERLHA